MLTSGLEFLKGIRVSNGSVKIYQSEDGEFIVVMKKYFLGFQVSSKQFKVKTYVEAEDYLLLAKNEMKITNKMLH